MEDAGGGRYAVRGDLASMLTVTYLIYGRSASGTKALGTMGAYIHKLKSLQRLGRQRGMVLRHVLERAWIACTGEAASTKSSSMSSYSALILLSTIADCVYVDS